MEDLLALKDVHAVLVSTADFQHATHLKLVAEAGKDCYCEKPMANDLGEAGAARDAVLARDLIVEVGTQHRREPYQIRGPGVHQDRRAGRGHQGRDRLELSWTAVARTQ